MGKVSHIEMREREGIYFVFLLTTDIDTKPKYCFHSSNKVQAENVARQFAKQHRCLIRYTLDTKVFSDTLTPDDDPSPAEAEGEI